MPETVAVPTARKQRQQQTRASLLRSAGRVLAQRGLRASIDEVAAAAGLTKGAFYANFESKEELFLAMLDERFAERLAQVRLLSEQEGDLNAQVQAAGEDFARHLASDPDWQRLFFELAVHAARERGFREQLTARYRGLRRGLATVMERRLRRLDRSPPVDLDRLASMLFAMANGFALERLLEPEEATDELYAEMLRIFFAGLRALGEGDPGEAQRAGWPLRPAAPPSKPRVQGQLGERDRAGQPVAW